MTNQEAQTALANLKRYMSGGGAVDRVTNKAIDMAIEALTAQPEPKRVEWKTLPHKLAMICSCCGHDEPYKFSNDNTQIFNFCPNCGAKMEG